jgi:hypothetical protein
LLHVLAWDYFFNDGRPGRREGAFPYASLNILFHRESLEPFQQIMFTKMVESQGFHDFLSLHGEVEAQQFISQRRIRLTHIIREIFRDVYRLRRVNVFFKASQIRRLETQVLREEGVYEDRAMLARVLHLAMAYRDIYTQEYQRGHISFWDISMGKPPSEKVGVLAEMIPLQKGTEIFLGELGSVQVIKFLGYGFEHSVYSARDVRGREHVLKIAHNPSVDAAKKRGYRLLKSSGLPIVKWMCKREVFIQWSVLVFLYDKWLKTF